MTEHLQYLTIRNQRGREMLETVKSSLEVVPAMSGGDRSQFVMQTVLADDEAKVGKAPSGAPVWLGNILANILTWVGPKGLEFARYSIDYHYIRNWIHVNRHWGSQRAQQHIPEFAKRIVAEYNRDGVISKRAEMAAPFPGKKVKKKL